jgi:hypothetical protein
MAFVTTFVTRVKFSPGLISVPNSQNSLNLWHENIYVKFRQIYGTKIFMSNFGKFMAQKYLCQISADLCQICIYPYVEYCFFGSKNCLFCLNKTLWRVKIKKLHNFALMTFTCISIMFVRIRYGLMLFFRKHQI